jgi:hypothetical protein
MVPVLASQPAAAQQLIESYVARLSEDDHFNSNGERLTTVAGIIRQDRANFHRFGIRDPEDEGDSYFANQQNRAVMERLIASGRIAPAAARAIINNTPMIKVDIYRGGGTDFVNVAVFD